MGYSFFKITSLQKPFRDKLATFVNTLGSAIRDGKTISFADNDIGHVLQLQNERLKKKGLVMDYTRPETRVYWKQYIRDIVEIYKSYGFYGKTQIICAAVRTPKQFVDCAVAGADIVTAGLAVYKDSMNHAFTRQGIDVFRDAWDNTAGN